ncbi:MAG TPA: nitronate monooxygenase [Candidatus Methylacidiphilales bacterium]|jgi:nitronate monooxygenase|nr:nitronate monooxygenase [Candidatus Methylacidiphilales bacterium]
MSKWNDTRVTQRLGIPHPILQGPFGRGGSTAQLVATVSNLGGLGSFGANELAPEEILKTAAEIRKLTEKPFGLNLWVSTFDPGGEVLSQETYDRVVKILAPFYRALGETPPPRPAGTPRNFNEQVAAVLEARPAVFSFVFGIPPAEILHACREKGMVTAGGAATVDEAVALDQTGVDLIVASGFEAGGHRTSFLPSRGESTLMGTFSLVPQIADKVKAPVIAAGGIADGRGIAAALVLGAEAAQVGTAFFACEESGATPAHRELLFGAEAKNTGLTRAFTGRLGRGFYNKMASELKALEPELARYPAQTWIIAPLRAAALKQKRMDLVGLWAGQSAPLLKYRKAEELFAALVRETEEVFRARSA